MRCTFYYCDKECGDTDGCGGMGEGPVVRQFFTLSSNDQSNTHTNTPAFSAMPYQIGCGGKRGVCCTVSLPGVVKKNFFVLHGANGAGEQP